VAIQTGISNGRLTEVTGGELRAGDRVVVEETGAASASSSPPRMRLF
jgi:hypothetical protein